MATVSRVTAAPPRVVLDTNVLLSALIFSKGLTARLRAAWQTNMFLPLASTATTKELMRVLEYPKFRLDGAAREELLGDYLPWVEVVQLPDPPLQVPACRDPLDLPFLHLAAAGGATLLVSGEADLLALAGMGEPVVSFAIVSPATFLRSLGLDGRP